MAKTIEEVRQELDKEFHQFRENLGKVLTAVSDVEKAGPEDDISGLLEALEDAVKDVRTGGLMGSGAHGHRAALKDYLALKNLKL